MRDHCNSEKCAGTKLVFGNVYTIGQYNFMLKLMDLQLVTSSLSKLQLWLLVNCNLLVCFLLWCIIVLKNNDKKAPSGVHMFAENGEYACKEEWFTTHSKTVQTDSGYPQIKRLNWTVEIYPPPQLKLFCSEKYSTRFTWTCRQSVRFFESVEPWKLTDFSICLNQFCPEF